MLVETIKIPLEEYGVAEIWSEKYEQTRAFDSSHTISRLRARLLTTKQELHKFPKSWVDSVKERFYPAWALKRWPVQYEYVWRNTFICPHIAAPAERHLEFLTHKSWGER